MIATSLSTDARADSFLVKAFDSCLSSSRDSKDYKICANARVKPCRCREFTEQAITFSCNIITANMYRDCLAEKDNQDALSKCMAGVAQQRISEEMNKKLIKVKSECKQP